MKQLIVHIQKSIYGPAYYQELLSRSFPFSWKYFSAFALLLALSLTVVLSVPLVPKVLDATHNFPPAFFAYFPDDLEVRVEKGIASSNVIEPYFLPLPAVFKGDMGPDTPQSLLVIDTATPFSTEQWNAYKTIAWLGKDQVAMLDDNSGIRIETFGQDANLTVNERVLKSVEEKIAPLYKFAAPIVVLAVYLGILMALGVNFVYLIFGSALIFLLGRLMKQRWSYGTSYRIGLHAMTLPLILETLLSVAHLGGLTPNFLFTAVMLVMVFVNFKGAASAPPPLTPTA